MNFKIIGSPKTKKNSSRIFMNKRTGAPFIMPSKSACDWSSVAVPQLIAQGADLLGLEVPLNLCARVYRDRATGDLINYLQNICDALEESGAVVNDKWITQFDGSRLLIDRVVPRVEVYLSFVET